MNIKFVVFFTEGDPKDKGHNLTKVVRTVKALVESKGYLFDAYTPNRLRLMGADELIKQYPEEYHLPLNAGAHQFGLFAWKPFVILHALSTMKNGDIIFYLDSNLSKYPDLRFVITDLETRIQNTLKVCDFYVGRELDDQHYKASEFCSRNQLEEIGGNTEFIKNFPLLIANNVIARVSDFSYNILLDWLAMCRVHRFITPPLHEDEKTHNYRWFCADQSVLNMVIARHIEEGLLPWFFPNIRYGRSYTLSIPNNDHIQFLKTSDYNLIDKQTLREQFANEIQDTQLFLKNIKNVSNNNNYWEDLNITIDQWKAVDDGHFDLLENGNYVLSDGEIEEFHLIRIEDDRFNNAEIDLEIVARRCPDSDPEVGLHVQEWGNVNICTVYESAKPFMHHQTIFADAYPIEDGFYLYHIRYFNYHNTISIGTGHPHGYYLGKNQQHFEIKSIQVKRNPLTPV